jgi:hypothetical protein
MSRKERKDKKRKERKTYIIELGFAAIALFLPALRGIKNCFLYQ